jgi:transposase
MGHLHTEEFKREAVLLAKTSGLTRKQVAADLGIGFRHWASRFQQIDRRHELSCRSSIC